VDSRASAKYLNKRKTNKEKDMNKDNMVGFSIGLLSGAVIGGVIALLFAPKTGKETRQLIKDKAVGIVEAVKDKTTEVVDEVKDKAKNVGNALRN
jgi:gas vesicle protein